MDIKTTPIFTTKKFSSAIPDKTIRNIIEDMMARKIISDEFRVAFDAVDAILTPTTPAPAWKIGEKSSPLENYLADIFTVTANIVGAPAISLPSGYAKIEDSLSAGLPLGIQLMASHMSEDILFEIGKKFLNE